MSPEEIKKEIANLETQQKQVEAQLNQIYGAISALKFLITPKEEKKAETPSISDSKK